MIKQVLYWVGVAYFTVLLVWSLNFVPASPAAVTIAAIAGAALAVLAALGVRSTRRPQSVRSTRRPQAGGAMMTTADMIKRVLYWGGVAYFAALLIWSLNFVPASPAAVTIAAIAGAALAVLAAVGVRSTRRPRAGGASPTT